MVSIVVRMTDEEPTEEEIREMNKKQLRKQFPSGWMETTRYETHVLVIDTLLEEPPNREFTVAELASESGASNRSIKNRISDLVELGVVTELPNREKPRYQLNQHSPIVRKLYELNTTVQRVKDGDLTKSVSPPSDTMRAKHRSNVVSLSSTSDTENSFTPGTPNAF